jgi:pimeloyl-[acyl-carrier protein] methyl ester esterase
MGLSIERFGDSEHPALVLLHGWAMHGGIFSTWTDALRQHFSIYCVDLPGHGNNAYVPDSLERVAAALAQALPRAIWCGWSLGGLYAMHAALHAQSIHKAPLALAMIASSPRFVAAEDWPFGMPQASFAKFAQELSHDWRGVVQRFLALEAMGSHTQSDDLRYLQAQVFQRGEPDVRALQQGLDDLAAQDLRAALAELKCPSLWLAGARDRLVKPEAMQFAAQHSGGQFVSIAHAGHAPFLHAGAQLTELLLQLRDAPGAQAAG